MSSGGGISDTKAAVEILGLLVDSSLLTLDWRGRKPNFEYHSSNQGGVCFHMPANRFHRTPHQLAYHNQYNASHYLGQRF